MSKLRTPCKILTSAAAGVSVSESEHRGAGRGVTGPSPAAVYRYSTVQYSIVQYSTVQYSTGRGVAGLSPAAVSGQTRCRTRAVNEPSAKFSQSQRRPLLGPSPG